MSQDEKKINDTSLVIYTDGACSGNPGPGGWGTIVLLPNDTVIELGAGEISTTNNQMELTAVIEGLVCINQETKMGGADKVFISKILNEEIENELLVPLIRSRDLR